MAVATKRVITGFPPRENTTLAILQKRGWTKLTKHQYKHRSGIELIRNINNREWMVKGGRQDGLRFTGLGVAARSVEAHL